ncbi:MAG: DUF2721 domain-containing protein [Ignavibacteriales bacterium]|nr:DUF2721 domain-containing protein [Ignavibacteriales bacterium]
MQQLLDINIATPALLFPAISLLLLAYTNRFLALAALIRELHSKNKTNPNEVLKGQINNLKERIHMIRDMQAWGIGSLFICVLCMLLILLHQIVVSEILFAVSLLCMLISLGLSIREIRISVHALDLHLSDLEHSEEKR